jgi:hypothetical protein
MSPYCDACGKLEEETFRAVREYLYAKPKSDIHEISAATGVPVPKLLEFIKDGRFGVTLL